MTWFQKQLAKTLTAALVCLCMWCGGLVWMTCTAQNHALELQRMQLEQQWDARVLHQWMLYYEAKLRAQYPDWQNL